LRMNLPSPTLSLLCPAQLSKKKTPGGALW
jgi:hypothetical protein